ncbi:MAG: hypothetical protein JO149_07425 [Gammaproteobacteria bacterium]|nr:hypothetical protein [Gammaproteobacteria bacterium]
MKNKYCMLGILAIGLMTQAMADAPQVNPDASKPTIIDDGGSLRIATPAEQNKQPAAPVTNPNLNPNLNPNMNPNVNPNAQPTVDSTQAGANAPRPIPPQSSPQSLPQSSPSTNAPGMNNRQPSTQMR